MEEEEEAKNDSKKFASRRKLLVWEVFCGCDEFVVDVDDDDAKNAALVVAACVAEVGKQQKEEAADRKDIFCFLVLFFLCCERGRGKKTHTRILKKYEEHFRTFRG